MNYETGKLLRKLPVEKGVSKAGKEWEKQEFIIETDAKFDPQICFSLFGDGVSKISRISEGEVVKVGFYVSSREFNGKWYHNISAKEVDVVLDQQQYSDSVGGQRNNDDEDDSLPF